LSAREGPFFSEELGRPAQAVITTPLMKMAVGVGVGDSDPDFELARVCELSHEATLRLVHGVGIICWTSDIG